MANQYLFKATRGKMVPPADTTNLAGGKAYTMAPKHALAQLAVTGCFGATYYANAESQLKDVIKLANEVPIEFVAKTAVYAREKGFMKDMPALLLALTAKEPKVFRETFHRVVDGMKMLRNFIQIMRSGATGRKSLGYGPKKMVQQALSAYSDKALFANSVGQNPSLPDIIKMVHPKPANEARKALYAYLIGKSFSPEALAPEVMAYENFKATKEGIVPKVPFQMLSTLSMEPKHWREIALNSTWQTLRMNLNKFNREGVFKDEGITDALAIRLGDPAEIQRSKVFPYQLMMAYSALDESVPKVIQNALQDAMELALSNVPKIEGNLFLFPDVSSSMRSPISGQRVVSSKVRCVDVAAMVAAAFAKRNPSANIIPFETDVVKMKINPRDSVMTIAKQLASVGGGGTNAGAPLALINNKKASVDMVIYISDNESWMDSYSWSRGTGTMEQWTRLKRDNPNAKMVCIDLVPNQTTQANEQKDILNVGGFSDTVFNIIDLFAKNELGSDHWVGEIEKVTI